MAQYSPLFIDIEILREDTEMFHGNIYYMDKEKEIAFINTESLIEKLNKIQGG